MNDDTKRKLAGLAFALLMTAALLALVVVGFGGLMDWFSGLSTRRQGGSMWGVLGVALAVFVVLLMVRLRRSRRARQQARNDDRAGDKTPGPGGWGRR